jgi:hypothetical protein
VGGGGLCGLGFAARGLGWREQGRVRARAGCMATPARAALALTRDTPVLLHARPVQLSAATAINRLLAAVETTWDIL